MLAARAAKGLEEEVEQGVRIPVGRGFAGRVAAERGPVQITDVDHADILNPILREKGLQSLLGVPLLVEDRLIGVLHVGALTSRVFGPDEIDLLQRAADRAALAIGARLYERQRGLAEELQRSLFPRPLPEFPGRLAGRALLARGGRAAGRRLVRRLPAAHGLAGPGHGRRGRPRVPGGRPDGAAAQRAARVRVRRQRAVGADDQAQHVAAAHRSRAGARRCSTWSSTPTPAGAARVRGPPAAVVAPGRETDFVELPQAVPLGVIANPVYDDGALDGPSADGAGPVHRRADGARRASALEDGFERLRAAGLAGTPSPRSWPTRLVQALLPEGAANDDAAVLVMAVHAAGRRARADDGGGAGVGAADAAHPSALAARARRIARGGGGAHAGVRRGVRQRHRARLPARGPDVPRRGATWRMARS